MGFIVALLLIILSIPLPSFINDTCRYLGNLTTPLSMLFIGNTIYYIDLKGIEFNKDIWGVLLGRFIISRFISSIIMCIFPFTPSYEKMFYYSISYAGYD